MDNKLDYSKIFEKYKSALERNLKLVLPELQKDEIDRAIDYSINKRLYNTDCVIDDNYRNKKITTNMLALYNFIQDKQPILTSYGCLFYRHGTVPNPTYQMIQEFADRRNKFKKEMLKYPKGSEEYNRYNLMQQVAKVSTNAIYGSMGASTSVFYNVHVATSITRQGRSSITSSIMLFESFLANNIKFGSLDEIITFIDHVITEKKERQYSDEMILDEPVSKESVFAKLILTCGYRWLPDEADEEIIWRILNRISQEDLNRIYYKNNLFSFFDNKIPMRIITNILKKLKSPFIDPNNPPSTIMDDLDLLVDLIKEYVYYHYQTIDKIERAETLIRQVDLTTDTDSCIITLNPWYEFISEKVKNENIRLKHYETDALKMMEKDNMNEAEDATKESNMEFIYSFKDDEVIQRKRSVNPTIIIPEDAMRHSIINILAYTIGKLLRDYFDRISITNNVTNEAHNFCLMNMKNEFLFTKMLLTDAKKNYATIVELQEGNVIPNEPSKRLDIKGLPITKSNIPDSTKKALSRILYENMLKPEVVDQMKIINDLAIIEKNIFDSIKDGNTDYFRPQKVKPVATYKDPFTAYQVKASAIYNMLKDEDEPAISTTEQSTVLIIKTRINKVILENSHLKKEYPEKYKILADAIYNNATFHVDIPTGEKFSFTLFTETSKPNNREITKIAIPFDSHTPKWILEFIDYTTIVNDNISVCPIESVGITRLGTNTAYTGIVSL